MATARTETLHPVTDEAAAGTQATTTTPKKTLAPNEVELSDGRVVALRRTNALDDTRIEGVVYDAYSNQMGIVPPTIMLRSQSLNGVMSIDGDLQTPINSKRDLELLMSSVSSEDMDAIADKYLEVMGRKQKMADAIREMRRAARGEDADF